MALTLGAHHVVTGAGQFAIAQPVGLVVSVSGIPAFVARDPGTPTLYKRMGHLNLGHTLGWQPPIELELVPQLLYPIAPEFTLLRHTLLAGETATIDELVGPAVVPSSLQPWDRAPTTWSMDASAFANGGTNVQLWTYTVPAGRCLWLATATVRWMRYAANAAPQSTLVYLSRGGLPILAVVAYTGGGGNHTEQSLSPSGMILFPGEVLRAFYTGGGVDGQDNVQVYASGFTFAQ